MHVSSKRKQEYKSLKVTKIYINIEIPSKSIAYFVVVKDLKTCNVEEISYEEEEINKAN